MKLMARIITVCMVLAAGTYLGACSGSGGSGPGTGQVVVTVTDGPTDQYERVLISMRRMTLIGAGGQQTIYDGPPLTFDLLRLRDRADFAFSQRVTAGDYNAIRLDVTEVRLVDLVDPDNPDDDVEVVLDKLQANGRILLNTRGSFRIDAGRTTIVELDIDALRSFQPVQTGNLAVRFRPVIFANIYQGDVILPSRLVRVFGTVESVDSASESLEICDTRFVAQLGGPSAIDSDACVRVFASGANHFDEAGLAIPFGDVVTEFEAGDPLQITAVGFASLPPAGSPDNIALDIDAVIGALGPRRDGAVPGWETTLGAIASGPTATDCVTSQCVDFVPNETSTGITVQLQPETRVFARDGAELSQGDLAASVAGAFDAVRVDNAGTEELRAGLFVIGPDAGDVLVSGMLVSVTAGTPFDVLSIQPESGGPVAVCVDSNTDVLHVLTDSDAVTLVDLLDPTVLNPADGLSVDVAGETSSEAGCDIDASVVIVDGTT